MFQSLVKGEKAWFEENKWGEADLVTCYATITAGIAGFTETLDRGNAARLTAYHTKAAAIKELVPNVENLVKNLVVANS